MRKYIDKYLVVSCVVSFILSLGIYFVYLFKLKESVAFESGSFYPISEWKVFVFFAKPLVLLVPFVVFFTVLGSYFTSLNWGKEISITTIIRENNGTFEKKSKIKFFSEEEKMLFKMMMSIDGDIYQNDLTIQSGLPRYQVSRIISRFEQYGIITKERFGMTNIINLNIDHVEFD